MVCAETTSSAGSPTSRRRARRRAQPRLTSPPRRPKARPHRRDTGRTMDSTALQAIIERAFEDRASITPGTSGEVRDAVDRALSLLDSGELRVATKTEGATGPGGKDETAAGMLMVR